MEWNLEDRGTTRSALVPTQAERNGDFSQGGVPGCSPGIPNDPLTGAPFANNRIDSSRISPGGPGVPESLPAAERHAGAGQLQQLGHVCDDAGRLEPVPRPRRLQPVGVQPHHGPLHAGRLEERQGRRTERQHAALGRRRLPGRRLATGISLPSRSSRL